MQKDSIKREQSQAGLSFAEREKFRPQVKNKLLLLLVLLMTAATGARAAWTGGTYTATANENLGAITVNGDATLTINSDVTVTVTGGINVASGTLTVTGPGTLVVTGAKGNDGGFGAPEGVKGGTGGVAISGNIIVQGGATVTATGGTGGNGGNGEIYGGKGGNGGNAFAGTLTYKSGTVTANGGSSGSVGWGNVDESYGSSGSAGKAFANDVDFTQTTGYSVTNGTSTIGSVLNQRKVVISGGSEPAAATTYTVSLKDGVKDADKWTISPNPAPEGSPVTIQYTGRLKVKGVKATSEAAEATPALSITSPSVGQVIGSDGKNYAYGSLPSGVTAVAKICYVSGSNGLALALTDEEGKMDWSTAQTACAAHTAPFTGGTWKLATKDEWDNMINAAGSYSALHDGFSSVGGTNMQEDFYWSSTEYDSDFAWYYDGYNEEDWDNGDKIYDLYVRACLAFTAEQSAKPAATVTTAPTGAAVVGVGKTTALVSGGAADGGTLMYAVTTTNTKPTSTAGFSDAVPTAETITASGTVYVWYYVKGDDTHSDSEIAATAIEVPVADIVWDVTNVWDIEVYGTDSYEKEGVTLSANAYMIHVTWADTGDPTMDGISFNMDEPGAFAFTAPTGKAFTKIEMKAVSSYDWNEANLGTGWAFNNSTVTWKGTAAASKVELLTGADMFYGAPVKCIGFYLSE